MSNCSDRPGYRRARLEVGEEKERKLGKKVYKFSQALK